MKFRICQKNEKIVTSRDIIRLECDNWEDFGLQTLFSAYFFDRLGREYFLGPTKIGMRGVEAGSVSNHISKEFSNLTEAFFSLGQDEVYYMNIARLGDEKREEILTALRDVAFDVGHYHACKNEVAMQRSLLRSISAFSVEGQLHRMALGGTRLANYQFSYILPGTDILEQTKMEFKVTPDSNPPTNVHVLIGRNGTGKTRLIKSMIRSICFGDTSWGRFEYAQENQTDARAEFANILCIAFSPFDDFSELVTEQARVPWSYIGLNKRSGDLKQAIAEQFFEALSNCMMVAWKRRLWFESIELLKSDPTFAEEKLDTVARKLYDHVESNSQEQHKAKIMDAFSKLSSGHKVVLLTVTGCVDKIEEQSIIFIDEPENHLHPPLLSALIRTLSNLLINRNGVAIISTHSPVVLQEVPSVCAWTLNKYGDYLKAERPSIQTFGAAIGSLTNEVFGLEVTSSGFHKMLREAVRHLGQHMQRQTEFPEEQNDYEKVASVFEGQLGNEADILLRTLLALQKKGAI